MEYKKFTNKGSIKKISTKHLPDNRSFESSQHRVLQELTKNCQDLVGERMGRNVSYFHSPMEIYIALRANVLL